MLRLPRHWKLYRDSCATMLGLTPPMCSTDCVRSMLKVCWYASAKHFYCLFLVCLQEGERPGIFYHVNYANVYVGRGWVEFLTKRTYFVNTFIVLNNEQYTSALSCLRASDLHWTVKNMFAVLNNWKYWQSLNLAAGS